MFIQDILLKNKKEYKPVETILDKDMFYTKSLVKILN